MPTAAATTQHSGFTARSRAAVLGSTRARAGRQSRADAREARASGSIERPNIIPARRRQEDGRVGDVRPAQSRGDTVNMQERREISRRAQTDRPNRASTASSPQIRPAARRPGAQEREQAQKQAQGAGETPKGGLGVVEDMAVQKFRTWLDHIMKLGLINIEAIPAWLAAVGLLNVRVLASLPPFKRTRFGKAFRFSADSIADAFNAKKGNFLALSPLTGAIAAGLVDAALALVVGVIVIILILPVYLLSLGVKALFDEGTRELLTMFVKGLF